jgi:hypothetical protein
LTVPLPVPGKLFWSVTVYDASSRSQVQTDQAKAVLSSLFDFADVATAPSVDLYFAPSAPRGHISRLLVEVRLGPLNSSPEAPC